FRRRTELDDSTQRAIGGEARAALGDTAEVGHSVGHRRTALAVYALAKDADAVGLEVKKHVAAKMELRSGAERELGEQRHAYALHRAGREDVPVCGRRLN